MVVSDNKNKDTFTFNAIPYNDDNLNLTQSFQELRENSSFFDVRVGCSNGQETSSLQAHKIILSSYSNVLKEMLLQLDTRLNPFIYLRGVEFCDLKAIIDFMYIGTVNVEQERLDSFLAVAKEFKIKGVNIDEFGVEEAFDSPIVSSNPLKLKRNEEQIYEKQHPKRKLEQDRINILKQMNKEPTFNNLRSYLTTNSSSKVYASPILDEGQEVIIRKNEDLKKVEVCPIFNMDTNNNIIEEDNDDAKTNFEAAEPNVMKEEGFEYKSSIGSEIGPPGKYKPIKDLVDVIERRLKGNGAIKKFVRCKMCLKKGGNSYIRRHVRAEHPDALLIPNPEVDLDDDGNIKMGTVIDFMGPADAEVFGGIRKKMFKCKVCLNDYQRKYVKQHIRKSHGQYLLNKEDIAIQLGPVTDFMKFTQVKIIQDIPRRFYRCTICLNEYQKKYVKRHIKISHSKHVLVSGLTEFQMGQVPDFMEPTKTIIEEDGTRKRFYRCKICLNEYQKKYVKQHIKTTHNQYIVGGEQTMDEGDALEPMSLRKNVREMSPDFS